MNRNKQRTWIVSVLAAGMLLGGYALGSGVGAEDVKPAKKMGASPAKAIADARCDQEARCGNVGAGKSYKTRVECTSQVKSKLAKELNAFECPGGYDQKELNECLEEIRNESCGNPFDTLERVISCRASDICKAS